MPEGSSKPAAPRRHWTRYTWPIPALIVVLILVWYAVNPEALPPPAPGVQATTLDNIPVYVGMLSTGDRTLRLRWVNVVASGGTVQAKVCRSGQLAVTTEAEAFCEELVDADGTILRPDDQLVLELRGDKGSTISSELPTIGYREGVQFGEGQSGRRVTVTVLP